MGTPIYKCLPIRLDRFLYNQLSIVQAIFACCRRNLQTSPDFLRTTRELYADNSFFLKLENVQISEKSDSITEINESGSTAFYGRQFLCKSMNGTSFTATSAECAMADSWPLPRYVGEQISHPLTQELADILTVTHDNVTIRQVDSDLYHIAVIISEGQETSQMDLTRAVYTVLKLVDDLETPIRSIETVLFPLIAVGNIDFTVEKTDTAVDITIYNLEHSLMGLLKTIKWEEDPNRTKEKLIAPKINGFSREKTDPELSSKGEVKQILPDGRNNFAHKISAQQQDIQQGSYSNDHKIAPESVRLNSVGQSNNKNEKKSVLHYLKEMDIDTTSIDQNETFAALGIDSLQSAELEYRLQKDCSTLPTGAILQYNTVNALDNYVASLIQSNQNEDVTPYQMSFPLSPQQSQLVFMNQLKPDQRSQFIETVAFQMENSYFDENGLHIALHALLMRHTVLRTVYSCEEQWIISGTEFLFPIRYSNVVNTRVTIDICQEMSVKLEVCRGDRMVSVYLFFHHIAVDGRSLGIITNELESLMKGKQLNEKCTQFVEVMPSGGYLEKSMEFWKETLLDHSTDLIATDFSRQKEMSFKGASVTKPLNTGITTRLNTFRKKTQCSDYAIFCAVYKLFVYKTCGLNDYVIGMPFSMRNRKSMETIGCFVNTLPLRYKIDDKISVEELVKNTSRAIDEAKLHENVPFHSIVRELRDDEQDDATMPLFQIMLIVDRFKLPSAEGPIQPLLIESSDSKYEQTWYFENTGTQWNIKVEYCTELFSQATIQDQIDRFLFILDLFSQTSHKTSICDISISTNLEHKDIFNEIKKNTVDYPTIPINRIHNQNTCKRVWKHLDSSWTHQDLQQYSDNMANQITQVYTSHYGELPAADRMVIFVMKRSLALPAIVLATWQTGMAAVPLSLDWTVDNILATSQLFGNPILITKNKQVIEKINEAGLCAVEPIVRKTIKNSRKFERTRMDDLAYVTCTSGSTGKPKAVCTPFRGQFNLAMNYVHNFFISQHSTVYSVVNYSFDIFFADLSKIFSSGCSAIIADQPIPLRSEMEGATNAYIMPAFLSAVQETDVKSWRSLETLQFGGEAMLQKTLNCLANAGIHSYQEYGMTEQTVYTSMHRMKLKSNRSCAGKSYWNLHTLMRDRNKNLLPSKYSAELFVVGMLSRGYYDLQTTNSERYSKREYGREFKTGDKMKGFNDQLYFLERLDQQVKIRGRAVDLAEVQHQISQHQTVSSVIVMVHSSSNKTILTAYVVTERDSEEELRLYLQQRLPAYMVPDHFIRLPELPLSSNGKVDKKKLPVSEPKTSSLELRDANSAEEKLICATFSKYVGKNVPANACFFEMGGDSVKAMIVVQELKQHGFEIQLADLLSLRTAEKLVRSQRAARVHFDTNKFSSTTSSCDDTITSNPTKDVLEQPTSSLSDSQQRLWFLETLEPEKDSYIVRLQMSISGQLDVPKLHKSIQSIVTVNISMRTAIVSEKGIPHGLRLSGTESYYSLCGSYITQPRCEKLTPLLSIWLERSTESFLHLWIHHIICDGRSLAVIAEQLSSLYNGNSVQFCNPTSSVNIGNGSLDFWKNYLSDYSNSQQSLQKKRQESPNRAGFVEFNIDAKTAENMSSLSRKCECSIFHVLCAAFYATLRHQNDSDDIVFGTTSANRRIENFGAVGMFVNTIPLRFSKISENVEELLHYVKGQILMATENENVSLHKIEQQWKSGKPTTNGNLFDHVFTFQNASIEDVPPMNGLSVTSKILPPKNPQFPQSWLVTTKQNSLHIEVHYDRNIHNIEDVADIFQFEVNRLVTGSTNEKGVQKDCTDNSNKRPTIILPKSNDMEKEKYRNESLERTYTNNNATYIIRVMKHFKDVLQKDIEADANFFEEGGHSLLATRLKFGLEQEFGFTIPLRRIFEYPTAEQISCWLGEQCDKVLERQDTTNTTTSYSPTPFQMTLLKSFRNEKVAEMYRTTVRVEMKKTSDKVSLIYVFNRLIMHHSTLRSRFHRKGRDYRVQLLSGTECFATIAGDTNNYCFVNDSALKIVEEANRVLRLETNHIYVDGHSMGVIVNNIERIINGETMEKDTNVRFNQYLTRECQNNTAATVDYWSNYIQSCRFSTVDNSKTSSTIPVEKLSKSTLLQLHGLQDNVRELSKEYSATPFQVVVAATMNVLNTLSKNHSLKTSIGFPFNLRTPEHQNAVAYGITSLFVSFEAQGQPNSDIQLAEEHVSNAISHPFIPFEKLVSLSKDGSLFDVMLTFDDYTVTENELFKLSNPQEEHSKFPISVFMNPQSDEVRFDYQHQIGDEIIIDMGRGILDILKGWTSETLICGENQIQSDIEEVLHRLGLEHFTIRRELNVLKEVTYKHDRILNPEIKNELRLISDSTRNVALSFYPTNMIKKSHDLSTQQMQMYFLSKTKSSNNYSLPFIRLVPRGVTSEKMHEIFLYLIQMHEMLRTKFVEREGVPQQIVLSMTESYHHLVCTETSDPKTFIANYCTLELAESSPPVKAVLVRTDKELVAVMCLHHIISDAWSTNILEKDLEQLVEASFTSKLHIRSKEKSYLDLVYRSTMNSLPEENYLHSLTRNELHLIPTSVEKNVDVHVFQLAKQKVQEIVNQTGFTPFAVFLHVISTVLSEHYGIAEMNVGFPYFNRTPDFKKVVGYFLNNLVINIGGDSMTVPNNYQLSESSLNNIDQNLRHVVRSNIPFATLNEKLRNQMGVDNSMFDVYVNCRYQLETSETDNIDISNYLPVRCEFPIEIDIDQTKSKFVVTVRTRREFVSNEDAIKMSRAMKELLTDKSCSLEEKSNAEIKSSKQERNDELMEKILRCAKKVLRTDVLSPETNFYAAGGNSLKIIDFIEQLEEELSLEIDFDLVHGASTFYHLWGKFRTLNSKLTSNGESNEASTSTSSNGLTMHEYCGVTLYQPDIPPISKVRRNKEVDIPKISMNMIFEKCAAYGRQNMMIEDASLISWSYEDALMSIKNRAHFVRNTYAEHSGQTLRGDTILPMLVEKSSSSLFSCLAIQMAGAAYLPVDSSAPPERIDMLLQPSHVHYYYGPKSEKVSFHNIDMKNTSKYRRSWKNLTTTTDIAYVISTSGTTGTPKAVCATHAGVCNMANAGTKDFFLNSQDVIYQFTKLIFDNSVLEIFMSICNSATLFCDQKMFTPRRFTKQIDEHNISICLLFPGIVSIFRDDTFGQLEKLRYWIVGAEKLPQKLFDKAIDNGISIIQNYGPTEMTAYALTKHMRRWDNPQNLGKTIQNTEFHVDDTDVNNQLFLRGRGLMRGYLNRDTNKVLLKRQCELWYPTGDIVAISPTNDIIFIGRSDSQVKIWGNRVELGEIETLISSRKEVKECRVIWDSEAETLTAYCRSERKNLDEIKAVCHAKLPAYMVPDKIVSLSEFPLTSNAKVDIKRLVATTETKENWIQIIEVELGRNIDPSKTFIEQGGSTRAALKVVKDIQKKYSVNISVKTLLSREPIADCASHSSDLAKLSESNISSVGLRRVWASVLDKETIKDDDHFFLGGGNSILLLKLRFKISQELGKDVTISDLLENLTFSAMLQFLNKTEEDKSRTVRVVKNCDNATHTLVFVHALYGGSVPYAGLMRRLARKSGYKILTVSHPNTFSLESETTEMYESIGRLCEIYANELRTHLKGEIVLVGASLGGTLGVEIARILGTGTPILLDSTADFSSLQELTFEMHKKSCVEMFPGLDGEQQHWMIVNSWDLLLMLQTHVPNYHRNLYLLSINGSSLGWKQISNTHVIKINGTHSTMLDESNCDSLTTNITNIIESV